MATQSVPNCPGCGSKKSVVKRADGDCWCGRCQVMFAGDDPEGMEGGDYYSDPSRRMELQEERKVRRR